jgi:hypothetical protein
MSVMTVERGLAPGPAKPPKMPAGIALSATLHIGLFALILLGLPHLFRQPPPEEMPIAVQLVTIAPDTKATQPNPFRPRPDAKPDQAVAPPAPKPEPKPEPPTPVPEPPASASAASTPAPPAKPEVKPAAPPPLPPPPKPVEAQAPPQPPILHPESKKADPAAFDKLVKNLEQKKPDPAAFDRLMKNLEQKQPEPAAFDSLLKNLTREQTAQAEDAPPQPHRVAATAPPSSQPKAPLGAQLTASELDALREQIRQQLIPCWSIPAGARDAKDLEVRVRAAVSPDGTVRQATIVDQGGLADPLVRAAAESARRTFFNPRCTPLKLPADKYEVWKDLVVSFSPKDIL